MRRCVPDRAKANGFLGKIFGVFLFFVALLLAFLLCRVPAEASEYTDGDESRSIAIVFDNSGSMYTSTAWSNALYSMEVFAAMADEGDGIGIYPLNPIEVDGETYTSESPLTLHGGADASVIRRIYTPSSLDAYIETITDAYNGLLSMGGEDRWLIVMSDGDIYYEDGQPLDSESGEDRSVTQERLDTMLSEYDNSVNVVYLAIGDEAIIPAIDGPMYSEVMTAAEPSDILWDMIEISDLIYGREGADTASGTLAAGQPMADLILFAQGEDIENLRLVDADGNEAGTLLYSVSPLYAEAPGSGSVAVSPVYYADNATDTSLAGEIVCYGEIPEGSYTIEYDGSASSVRAYYKPGEAVPVIAQSEETAQIAEEAGLAAAEEELQADNGGREHPVRFRVLIVLLFILIAAAVVLIIFMSQRALPNGIRARVTSFTVNGNDEPDIKKPYLRYSGGGKKYGRIVIGPRPGTTDFDYKLILNLEASGRRINNSAERGAVIVSPPTKIGNIYSYAIDGDKDKFAFTMYDQVKTKDRIYLGHKFTYTMQAEKKDDIVPDSEESVTMVIELEFK